jgi:hypothetical protein
MAAAAGATNSRQVGIDQEEGFAGVSINDA